MSMEKKLRRKSEHGSHSSVYKVLQYVVSNSSVQYLEDYRYWNKSLVHNIWLLQEDLNATAETNSLLSAVV